MPMTPKPGTLRVVRGHPNPNGAEDAELFLFVGDATIGPIERIIPAKDVKLPERRVSLDDRPFRLKVLHFNDLHGHICQLTPSGHVAIFSRIERLLNDTRKRYRNNPNAAVLVMSAGDDLVGSIFDELLGDDPASYIVHAGYRLSSAAGVDVSALGNHDLDLGVQLLAHAIRQDARFPLLSANLTGSRQLADLHYPAALFVTKGVRVGVVGLTTPAEAHPQAETDLRIVHPIQTALNIIPAIRPFCDVLIVLSHLGYSLAGSGIVHDAIVRDAGDVELALSLPHDSVHLIVGGHTHQALNEQGLVADNIVNNIPIVQAGAQGRFVGEVDITLQREAAVTDARLICTTDLPDDQAFEQEHVQPLLALARPFYTRKLGQVASHADLSTDAVRNAFAAGESALANFITDGWASQCRRRGHDVDVAVVDASCVQSGLPVGGELTYGDWFNVMPFADTLYLRRMTGSQLKALIQDNALRVDRPGEPHTERGFLHFNRLVRYVIELGPSRGEAQAANITVEGRPIDELLERSFLVAGSSFLRGPAATWENYASRVLSLSLFQIHQIPFEDTHLFARDLMLSHIGEHNGVTDDAGAHRDGRLQVVR